MWLVGNLASQWPTPEESGAKNRAILNCIKDGPGWSTENQDEIRTDKFRAWPPNAKPTATPPSLPGACNCSMHDPNGLVTDYQSGDVHREYCPASKTFAECTSRKVKGKTEYYWKSCRDVKTCNGELAKNICGQEPSESCPGITEYVVSPIFHCFVFFCF